MYYILEFPPVRPGARKDIAIVHQNWIHGKTCFWPSFWKDSKKLATALIKGEKPNKQSWASYNDWRIVGNKLFETYDLARKMLPKAADCSDLSSSEHPKERLRNRRRRNEEHSDEGSSESSDHHTPAHSTPPTGRLTLKSKRAKKAADVTLPPFPALPVTEDFSVQPQMLIAVADGLNTPPLSLPPPAGFPGTAPLFEENDIRHLPTTTEVEDHEELNLINNQDDLGATSVDVGSPFDIFRENLSQLEANMKSSCDCNNTDILESIKALQTNQDIMMAKQDMMLDYMRALLKGRQVDKDLTNPQSFALPLTEMDRFMALENEIKTSSSKRKELALALSKKGGNSTNQITYRIMSALLTDNLMLKFSFAGHTGRPCFRGTVLLSAICEAVRLTEKGSVANDKEIEKAVEYWLKKASTRIRTREERQQARNN